MRKTRSIEPSGREAAQIPQELRVFAWNLRSIATPFERQSLALNTIEHGRAWHWGLLPAGWADTAFILRHGQLKTKRAFATFFPNLKRNEIRPLKQLMKIKKPAIAKPYLLPKLAPVNSKYIPGLKVTRFADLIDAKISALSTRGFARDLVDLYAAHEQRHLNWRSLLLKASRNQLNDYNPVELENNLKLIEQEFENETQAIPCVHPPKISDLRAFVEELRTVNAAVARELARLEGGLETGLE